MAGMAGGKGSWIGGLINTLFGIGSAYENDKVSKAWSKSARANNAPIMALSQKMLDTATEDWDRFKTTFAPVEQAAASNAAQDPDIQGAEGEVASAVASGMDQGAGMATQNMVRRGINPNSGNFSATTNDMTISGGRAGGFGMGKARRGEEDRVFANRANISAGARRIPGEVAQSRARTIDMLQTTTRKAAGIADAYGGRVADSLYNAGRGVGQMSSIWGSGQPDSANQEWSNSRMEDGTISAGSGYVENAEQYSGYADGGEVVPGYAFGGMVRRGIGMGGMRSRSPQPTQETTQAPSGGGRLPFGGRFGGMRGRWRRGYADGGMINGPGTGSSDSVPATIDGEQPAKVSNGEFLIPAEAVQRIGKRYLDDLVRQYHKPSARIIDSTATRVG